MLNKVLLAVCGAEICLGQTLPTLSEKDRAPIQELAATAKLAPAAKPRAVLVFYKCEGFVHGHGIVALNEAIRLVAEKQKAFRADFANEYEALTAANLERYDAVVLNNTTALNTQKHPDLVPALQAFVKSGKGLAVIHSGADNFNQSPEGAEMVGGHFWGHPWHAGGTWTFKLDDPANPVNAMFGGRGFKQSDEIYQQSSPAYNRAKLHVLLSLDMKDPATAQSNVKDQHRADHDHAVSWIRPYGKGRVFYTSFGHDQRACQHRGTFDHLFAGLQYALGDLAADDTPAGLSPADLARIQSATNSQEIFVYLQDILANTHCAAVDAANREKLKNLRKAPDLTPAAKQALERLFLSFGTPGNPAPDPACLTSRELRELTLARLVAQNDAAARRELAARLAAGPSDLRAGAAVALAQLGESAPLLAVLDDADEAVATAAIAALGDLADPAALAALSRPHRLENARLLALASCLGAFVRRGETALALPTAQTLFHDHSQPPSIRVAAAQTLLAADPAFFSEAVHDSEPSVRGAVIAAATAVPTATLAACFTATTAADRRLQLIAQLAKRTDPAAAAALVPALADADGAVARAAIHALARIGTLKELPALVDLLQKGGPLAAEAATALGNYRAPGAGRALLDWAAADAKRLVRILPILAERQEAALLSAIGAYTASADPVLRKTAWKALGKQATAERLAPYATWFRVVNREEMHLAASAFRTALKNAEPTVRQATLAATWAQSGETARQALAPLLASFASPDDLPLFAEALQSGGTDLREAVLRAAGNWNDFGAYPLLRHALESEGDESLRRVAFQSALGLMKNFGGEKRHAGYRDLFKVAPSEGLRHKTVEALYALEWVGAFETLSALARDANAAVSEAARNHYRELAEQVLKDRGTSDLREIDWHHWGLSSFRNDTDVWLTNDRNLASRWDSAVFSKKGMWFMVDIGRPVFLRKIVLDTDRSPDDTPNGCEVFVSPDGKTWTGPVAAVDGHTTCQTVIPLAATTRWAKMVTTGGREKAYWSIHELYLYEGITDAAAERIRRQAADYQTKKQEAHP